MGFSVIALGEPREGGARAGAPPHAELARRYQAEKKSCVLISGGETTVTVKGGGRGGRNSEYLLALTLAPKGTPGIWAIACDTDGIDGTESKAGATTWPDTPSRGAAPSVDAEATLPGNDAYGSFHSV